MMLAFVHEGCDVITSSWTASFRGGRMTLCYARGTDAVTRMRNISFRLTRDKFCDELGRAARGGYPLMLQGDN